MKNKFKILLLIYLNTLFLSGCSIQHIHQINKEEKMIYEVINFRFLRNENLDDCLFYKTNNSKIKGIFTENPYNQISYSHNNEFERSIEIDTLFNEKEKKIINKKILNLKFEDEIIFNPKKLKIKNLYKNKGSKSVCIDIVTLSNPIFINSKDKIYSLIIIHTLNGGGIEILEKENGKWRILYSIALYYI